MRRIRILFLLLFFPLTCSATDLKPWFGNDYEVEIRALALFQNYHSIATSNHRHFKHHKRNCNHFNRNENDVFLTLSGIYPFKRYSGEFEATAAHTHHQHPGWDCFRVTGRYQWLNDTEDDPISVVTGLTVTEPFSRALHDVSSFHHGHIEGEMTLSYGKKYGYPGTKDYVQRWWNVLGLGIADNSSAWVRGDAAYEYKYQDRFLIRGFINTLWGTGREDLIPCCFKGYGYINHKSVDVGIRYGYIMDCGGTLSIQYARRVYASNFPENNNLILFEYYYPFGTQSSSDY